MTTEADIDRLIAAQELHLHKSATIFAYCDKCRHLWLDCSGEAVVHPCSAQNDQPMHCPTQLARRVHKF